MRGCTQSRDANNELGKKKAKILAFADDVIVLENGQVVKAGKAQSLVPDGKSLGVSSAAFMDDGAAKTDAAGSAAVQDSQVAAYAPPNQDALDAIDPKRQQGDWSVYSYYFKAAGRVEAALFLGLMMSWTVCEQFSCGFSFRA